MRDEFKVGDFNPGCVVWNAKSARGTTKFNHGLKFGGPEVIVFKVPSGRPK